MDRQLRNKHGVRPPPHSHQVHLTLTDLPYDCLLCILKWLGPQTLLAVCCVNKFFRYLGSHDSLWRRFAAVGCGLEMIGNRRLVSKKGFWKHLNCSERKWMKGALKPMKLLPFKHNNLMPWLQITPQGSILIATNGSSICSYQIQKLLNNEKLDNSIISELKGHKDDVVRFARYGKRIYSAGMDKAIRAWEVSEQKGKCIGVLQGHHQGVYCIDANRDLIISGSRDQTIKIWSESNFHCLKTIPTFDIARCLCINDFKKQFLVGTAAHNIRLPALRIFDLNVGKMISGMTSTGKDIERLGAGILHVKLEDPFSLLSCGYDTTVRLWDLRMRCCVRSWSDPHDNAVFCFQSNRNWMIWSGTSRHGVIRQWDKRMSKPCRSIFTANNRESSPVYSLQFTHDSLFVGLSSGIMILKLLR